MQFSAKTYIVNEGAGKVTITLNLNAASGQTITVDYASFDGTATSGSDYTAINGTLTFNSGVKSQNFTLPITDNTLDEADETIMLTLSNPINTVIWSTNPAILNIEDNDQAGSLIYLPIVNR